jgi:hypothetical protein
MPEQNINKFLIIDNRLKVLQALPQLCQEEVLEGMPEPKLKIGHQSNQTINL